LHVEAVKGNAVKLSSGDLEMAPAMSNAPGSAATGTFTAQVLGIGGI
jgi:hypothetical protein